MAPSYKMLKVALGPWLGFARRLPRHGKHGEPSVLLLKDVRQIDDADFSRTDFRAVLPSVLKIGRQQPLRAMIDFDLQDSYPGQSRRVSAQNIQQRKAFGVSSGSLGVKFDDPGTFLKGFAQSVIEGIRDLCHKSVDRFDAASFGHTNLQKKSATELARFGLLGRREVGIGKRGTV